MELKENPDNSLTIKIPTPFPELVGDGVHVDEDFIDKFITSHTNTERSTATK